MIRRLLRTSTGRRVRRRVRILRQYRRLRPSRVTIAGTSHVIHVDPHEPRGWAIVTGLGRGHQPALLRLWRSAVEVLQPDTVVDVGVNYGEFLFSSSYRPATRVIGIEANRRLKKWLERSHAEHPDRERIELIYALATDTAAEAANFWLDTAWSGRSRAADPDVHRQSDCAVLVHDNPPAITIDGLVEGVEPGGFVFKIDTEGWEGHVLRGMESTLCRASWILGIVEYQPAGLRQSGTDPEEFLWNLGRRYALWAIDRSGAIERLSFDGGAETALQRLRETKGEHPTTDLMIASDAALVHRMTGASRADLLRES